MPTLTCSGCGDPIPLDGDIAAELPKLPGGATVRVLCSDCAKEEAPPPPTRTFTVSVLIRELIAGQEATSEEDQVWEDVGGFTLRGTGGSVREFAYEQADEYQRRMEAILSFADEPGEVPGIKEKVEEALKETASADLPAAPDGPAAPDVPHSAPPADRFHGTDDDLDEDIPTSDPAAEMYDEGMGDEE